MGATVERTPAGWVLRAAQPRGAALRLEGPWDWSEAAQVVWEVRASSGARVRVTVVHGPQGRARWVFYFVPKAGLRLRVAVPTADLRVRPANTARPGYFTFGGGPDPVDLAHVAAVVMEYDQDGPPAELVVEHLRAEREAVAPAILDPRPSVDAFGQWRGLGGAPRDEAEIRRRWAAEERALLSRPGLPPGASPRSLWGGDARHRLAATGRFRVDRFRERWCLVDPDGHPFFSVGPDVVRPEAEGPTAGQEALFADLAEASVGAGRADFYARNLWLRYRASPDPRRAWAEMARARLRAWGFNTVGNWSVDAWFAGGDIPWVTGLSGVQSWCHQVPDVFDPGFRGRVEAAVRDQVARHVADPALIGYFVGNEPAWTFPGAVHPLQQVFGGAHPHTAARAVAFLRARYHEDLRALEEAWGTTYASWEELERRGPPDPRRGGAALGADAADFAGLLLEGFYGACCAAVRALDPDRLLLGPRFYSAAMPEPYLRAAAVFDVVSFNCYERVPPPDAVDRLSLLSGRPVLIGEFHFGVAGRGMSGALVSVQDDAARGEAYAAFVGAAAVHPAVVGAHWFQWVDEPVTGRFDGEDYNIGLVDVTDVPYQGLVEAARRIHGAMYRLRFGG